MDIGIMGKCENKCSFCYQGDKEEDHMTFEDYSELISQSKWFVNQIALGGRGDPNLHPKFAQILLLTRYNHIVPNYTTSGKNLTDGHVRATAFLCGAVAVSMYEKDFTFNALKMFMDAKCKTNIHYVLSSESISKAIDLLKGKNV